MTVGRFAPSPTGTLHLGNLRTALVAWLAARSAGGRFIVRMEDLDPVTSSAALGAAQLDDLAALGLDWDGPVEWQSSRFGLYSSAIERLAADGLVYECFCTRREILAAAAAPHGPAPEGAYPGTCRSLSAAARAAHVAAGRRPALRLRTDAPEVTVVDAVHGPYTAAVDDLVLRRSDDMPAYNLAVVVDDAAQGVTQVVRGDDLLPSTPRQVHLGRLLGLPPVSSYVHVPLVLGATGQRLAKRDGAVTLADQLALGHDAVAVRSRLAWSLGLCAEGELPSLPELVARFDVARLPHDPWVLPSGA